jgi:hypothetical protein
MKLGRYRSVEAVEAAAGVDLEAEEEEEDASPAVDAVAEADATATEARSSFLTCAEARAARRVLA